MGISAVFEVGNPRRAQPIRPPEAALVGVRDYSVVNRFETFDTAVSELASVTVTRA